MTVFPNGKHDDQVDSTAQFLDWFKRPFPSQGIFELMRMEAEQIRNRARDQNPERFRVRLRAPPGISGSVQTFSRRHIDLSPDELSKCLLTTPNTLSGPAGLSSLNGRTTKRLDVAGSARMLRFALLSAGPNPDVGPRSRTAASLVLRHRQKIHPSCTMTRIDGPLSRASLNHPNAPEH